MEGIEKPFKVLLAPLDWGLGHAARCIPLITALLKRGCRVIIAAEGPTAELLSLEFPQVELLNLEGYRIRYGKKGVFQQILFQIPGILNSINKEKKWLKNLLQHQSFDLIISDNRPGFYSEHVKSIYITHQLLIHSGKGIWADRILQKLHALCIKNFHSVWVPDLIGPQNLAGELAHPVQTKLQPHYLGLLSRLKYNMVQKRFDLLILLSGPEPQRTILEEKLISELKQSKKAILFIRGLPGKTQLLTGLKDNVEVHNHLKANELEQAMLASELIFCRSGYTTLMDLIKLKRKAVLIPTPGQPEQEYLAAYMQQQGYFPFLKQKDFQLKEAEMKAASFLYSNPFTEKNFEQYQKVIDQLF